MTMRFEIELDVKSALFVALDHLDLSGLGLDGETTYKITEADFLHMKEGVWHLVLDLERTSGQAVAQHIITEVVTEFFDAELVVDFGDVRQIPQRT